MKNKLRFLKLMGLALLVSSCSPDSEKLKPVEEVKYDDYIDRSAGNFIFDPSVDILFVVDNSGSMGPHQTNLSRNIQLFTQKIKAVTALDYHIGVITTDDEYDNGELQGTPAFVTKTTPMMESVLSTNLNVGTGSPSYYEMMFDPVQSALTAPNLTGANVNFYRQNAYLAIIYITDAEDQSKRLDAKLFHNFLLNLKGGDANKLLVYGAIIPSGITNCARDEQRNPDRLEEFFKLANGISFSLCDPDYGDKLAEVGNNLVQRVSQVIRLTRAPIAESIRVVFGSQVIPNDIRKGWTFDPRTNSIYLGEELVLSSQPQGTKIEVYFDILNE